MEPDRLPAVSFTSEDAKGMLKEIDEVATKLEGGYPMLFQLRAILARELDRLREV